MDTGFMFKRRTRLAGLAVAVALAAPGMLLLSQWASGGDLTLSDEGAKFIAQHEGFENVPYNDLGTTGSCTVGVGHKLHDGVCNGTEATLSDDEVRTQFKKDADEWVQAVNRLVTVGLTQTQFDALVSFAFNVGYGEGGLGGSDLLIKVNAKAFAEVPAQFDRWHKPPEIIGRRDDERDLFALGRY